MESVFDEAMNQIFDKWTILALAVEHGWGGRNSREKRNQLQAEVVDYLVAGSKKRRPPSHEDVGDVEALATHLYSRLDELFNLEADDGSDMEVAGLCLRLFNTCHAGDFSFAQQFLEAIPKTQVNVSQCKGVDVTEYATEEDRLLDQMQGKDIDSGGDSGPEGEPDEALEQAPAPQDDGHPAPAVEQTQQCSAQQEGHIPEEVAQEGAESREADEQRDKRRDPLPEPVVDEDGFTSVVKGRRRPR